MITLWDAGLHVRVLSVRHNDEKEIKLSWMVVSRALHLENYNMNVKKTRWDNLKIILTRYSR